MKALIAVVGISILAGCATGADYRADSYSSAAVNQRQEVHAVTILGVQPAKVAVDNSANKRGAMVAGTVLGAVAGALIGGGRNAGAGLLLGGAAGAGATSLVSNQVLVDGVQILYQQDGHSFTSPQVGQLCEYKAGPAMIVGSGTTSRIQPNAQCPAKG